MKKAALSIALLICSNLFMNVAWYGHLKFKDSPIWMTILASWGIAFFEYCLQVPANRVGSEVLSLTQLKVIQEFLSISTFVLFAFFAFKERPTLNQYIAFGLILLAVYFASKK
ncbi:MAG: DMT family protein [Armatimonadota bacterium]